MHWTLEILRIFSRDVWVRASSVSFSAWSAGIKQQKVHRNWSENTGGDLALNSPRVSELITLWTRYRCKNEKQNKNNMNISGWKSTVTLVEDTEDDVNEFVGKRADAGVDRMKTKTCDLCSRINTIGSASVCCTAPHLNPAVDLLLLLMSLSRGPPLRCASVKEKLQRSSPGHVWKCLMWMGLCSLVCSFVCLTVSSVYLFLVCLVLIGCVV